MNLLLFLREYGPGCLLGALFVSLGLLAALAWATEPACVVDDLFGPRLCSE